jgi:hypothetical protein
MRQPETLETGGCAPATSNAIARPILVTVEDEKEFFEAVNRYKDRSGRLFPTCSELLEVLKSLGYGKRIWKPVETWSLSPETSPILGRMNEPFESSSV